MYSDGENWPYGMLFDQLSATTYWLTAVWLYEPSEVKKFVNPAVEMNYRIYNFGFPLQPMQCDIPTGREKRRLYAQTK